MSPQGLSKLIQNLEHELGTALFFRTAQGVDLIGREALQDTMEDLIWDAASAFCTTAIWLLLTRKRAKQDSETKN